MMYLKCFQQVVRFVRSVRLHMSKDLEGVPGTERATDVLEASTV